MNKPVPTYSVSQETVDRLTELCGKKDEVVVEKPDTFSIVKTATIPSTVRSGNRREGQTQKTAIRVDVSPGSTITRTHNGGMRIHNCRIQNATRQIGDVVIMSQDHVNIMGPLQGSGTPASRRSASRIIKAF